MVDARDCGLLSKKEVEMVHRERQHRKTHCCIEDKHKHTRNKAELCGKKWTQNDLQLRIKRYNYQEIYINKWKKANLVFRRRIPFKVPCEDIAQSHHAFDPVHGIEQQREGTREEKQRKKDVIPLSNAHAEDAAVVVEVSNAAAAVVAVLRIQRTIDAADVAELASYNTLESDNE